MRDPGGIYLLLTVFVTYWSGLRMGLLSGGLVLAYLSLLTYIPWSGYHAVPWNDRHIFGLAIVFALVLLPLGLIQNRMRAAGIRVFDSLQAARAEEAERQRVEAELESREEMWQEVLEASLDAIIGIDVDGKVMLWNRSARESFGWTAEEILGKTLPDTVIPGADRDAYAGGFQRYVETGESRIFGRRLEMTARAKDGRLFPIELTVVPHRTKNGTIFFGFARDMTEQRKLSERLRQAQKMEAIGTLAAGIAHDFNNILAAISGNLALAREDIGAGNRADVSLQEIDKSVARATEVVRQILSFSRTTEPVISELDVEPALADALGMLRASAPATMEIDLHVDPELPQLRAEATDLHQIVLNLGINAVHALKGEQGAFQVQAAAIDLDEGTAESLLKLTSGRFVRISFGDTGCGMDPETARRVFDPFFTTKAPGEGTGLGLSVVYGIVERLGGAINVYSEPRRGTVFHVYVPAAGGTAPSESAVVATKPSAGHSERILYVDDDEALVFMVTRMLRRSNYQVAGYTRPSEALEAFRAAPDSFDLAVSDMSMPQLDGPALVRELRAIRPELPVVLVTGYIRDRDRIVAEELGVTELVLKPNTVAELAGAISRMLGASRIARR
ncbi:MAG TPA: PAS domain S-box protein [Fimbriimonadaceae bacterium]|nr:PAS domain S-box protein [Fimbriimonadaceae bacterium]